MSERPRFSLSAATTREAYDRIINSTDLALERRNIAYDAWDVAIVSGQPRNELAALRSSFNAAPFKWKWFEECFDWISTEIEPTWGWPYAWRSNWSGFDGAPIRSPTYELLTHTMIMTAYRIRDHASYARIHIPYTLWLKGGGCPAENEVARRHASRFAAGDSTAWPPFFPGDRSSLFFEVPQRGRSGVGAVARLDVMPKRS